MAIRQDRTIRVRQDFQGGLTLSASGAKNGLLAAVDLGILDMEAATEVALLIREASQRLVDGLNDANGQDG